MGVFRVLGRRFLTDDTFVIRVERSSDEIHAGQCFSVGTKSLGINREYSMYSGAHDDYVEFLIRKIQNGAVSSELGIIPIGSNVEIHGPFGEFCLDTSEVDKQKYLFVASGVGVAPFSSFIKTFPNLDYSLLHGIRKEFEKYDHETYSSTRYIPCVSRPEDNSIQPMRVTNLIDTIPLDTYSKIYLCGNQQMITDSVQALKNRNYPTSKIFTEVFF